MNKLSDRLQVIAGRINKGETMADIGTDHGFLPIYLVENRISPKAIMADISKPSLEKGKSNAMMLLKDFNDVNLMDFRVGDGLKAIGRGEVDAIVIAGMGGKLIRDILANDFEHTCSFKKFIFQPRIGQGHLRKWLADNGFCIINEDVVIEGDYIPEIITAISPNYAEKDKDLITECPSDLTGDSIRWKIPPWIVKAGGPVDMFLDRNIALEEFKLNNVKKAKVRNNMLEESIISDIAYLKNLKEEL
ncbi:MAG: class I SAM-dependent methyltransferase [Bacillota bacterium]|nr:class I SAM-dependent methyltransferase [Bacillota bacterium]